MVVVCNSSRPGLAEGECIRERKYDARVGE